ncbi:MAG: phosphoenolpyruvate--protein phosphotransferase, partial [Planctomycetes bacterium]|nr:phosphoenolpyruvate--protein phosphotransferase [Planctomycetota bacterium]
MEVKKGIGVSPGVVISKAFVLDAEEFLIPERHVEAHQFKDELARLRKATAASKVEVIDLRDRMADRIGKETAAIFDFHLRMLEDKVLLRKLTGTIRDNQVTAEHAVAAVFRDYAREFLDMPQFMAERVKDVHDIQKRLLRHLIGQNRESLTHLQHDVVLLTHDLTPSQTASLDRTHVLGLATDAGGRTSHTAIVAHALGIPAVVGLKDVTFSVQPGDTVIIDGNRGVVIIDPDEDTIAEHRQYVQQLAKLAQQLTELRDLPAVTRDGHEVTLLGNIEFPDEVTNVLEKGGVGIGLYRTEYLYLGSEVDPAEEQHYEAYCQAIALAQGRPVVIRTLDLGGDKTVPYLGHANEANPFLGWRSIRLSFEHPEMFILQIRAILRASAEDDEAAPDELGGVEKKPKKQVRVMFPMVTTLEEMRRVRTMVRRARRQLHESGIPTGNVAIG